MKYRSLRQLCVCVGLILTAGCGVCVVHATEALSYKEIENRLHSAWKKRDLDSQNALLRELKQVLQNDTRVLVERVLQGIDRVMKDRTSDSRVRLQKVMSEVHEFRFE